MQQRLRRWLIVPAALVIYSLGIGSLFAEVKWVYGRAMNADGELEFMEEHIVEYQGEQIVASKTIYYDADFNKIGEQVSDFEHGPQFGSYEFIDERLQYLDGARVMPNQILIYCQDTGGGNIKKKSLRRDSRQIVGQGFHQFIVANLDSLVQDEVISAKLVLPAQLDQFDIRISKHQIADNRIHVRIDLNNWFLRLFTPHLEAEYDLTTRRLISYRGLSMIADKAGKTMEVAVFYDYSHQRSMLGSRFSSKLSIR